MNRGILRAMRASRLVNLLLLLQTRGGLTAAELARELEVSVRTIHRDVEALSAAGVPIYADRGPHGGIRLVDGYRTRLTGMTADEAEALFLSGLPGPAAELGLGTVVTAARLKVLAALPTGAPLAGLAARRAVPPRRRRLVPGERAGPATSRSSPRRSGRGALVRIEYERGDAAVVRVIGPLGLVLKGGVWYVVATVDEQIRTYRVSRVVGAVVLEERAGAARRVRSRRVLDRVERRVRARSRRACRSTSGCRATVWTACGPSSGYATVEAAEPLEEPDPDWIRLRLELSWPEEVPGHMLAMGSSMEVLAPIEIRERVIASARRIIERYGRDEPR